ncbi:MAG: hypothetical protein AAB869_04615, partial [Patescibacteria group bacterium]
NRQALKVLDVESVAADQILADKLAPVGNSLMRITEEVLQPAVLIFTLFSARELMKHGKCSHV